MQAGGGFLLSWRLRIRKKYFHQEAAQAAGQLPQVLKERGEPTAI
jgi:hypothetical protein